ncbi:MAG: IS110 family transposase [Rhodocyclaceae bacterium]|nr:IS110 family transposase [Rhodocyclaceae bacterium]
MEALHCEMVDQKTLYLSLELSNKTWLLGFTDGSSGRSYGSIVSGDVDELRKRIVAAKSKFGLSADARVMSCYEAGRDGHWLHRALCAQGIENIEVDAASIEVNRQMRRAKTDQLDREKLLTMLLRYDRGEKRVWKVVHVPSEAQEDARRPEREVGRLKQEMTGHRNRIRSLLVLHNERPKVIGGRDWGKQMEALKQRLAPNLYAEVQRESARLALARQQLHILEAQARAESSTENATGKLINALLMLCGVGLRGSQVLVHELFAWRHFSNRRQVAGAVGLVPTPYSSGTMSRELGISKAGNKRVRAVMAEMAWAWLRYQPDSALSRWFGAKFAANGARRRRVGIVALARRLLIALWRYLDSGVVPEGARLKAA